MANAEIFLISGFPFNTTKTAVDELWMNEAF